MSSPNYGPGNKAIAVNWTLGGNGDVNHITEIASMKDQGLPSIWRVSSAKGDANSG